MSEQDNLSFRDRNGKEKTAIVIGIALLIIFVVGFVFGFYFFGIAGAFKLLGVQYHSIWSLVLFVVNFLMLSIIVELFFKVLYKLFIRNITAKMKLFLIKVSFEAASNWLVLFTVDEFMNSITLSVVTEIILALLFSILETVLTNDKDK